MKARDLIIKIAKQSQSNTLPLPEIEIKAIPTDYTLVQKFKFEFERVGGIFISTEFEKIFDEISKIIHAENIEKIFVEKFENEIDNIMKNLPVRELITQPHSEKQIAQVDASITKCDFLIAETGTIVFIHSDTRFKSAALLPRVHIVIANKEQIYRTLGDVFANIKNFDSILLITGPSRTADIEKVIVQGVHGPQKVYLLII